MAEGVGHLPKVALIWARDVVDAAFQQCVPIAGIHASVEAGVYISLRHPGSLLYGSLEFYQSSEVVVACLSGNRGDVKCWDVEPSWPAWGVALLTIKRGLDQTR